MIKYIPLNNYKSETVALAIYNQWICQYEAPEYLLSDNGNCFISRINKSLSDMFGIKRIFSTSYHPETQGSVERNNRWIKERLRLLALDNSLNFEKYHNWDIYLPTIESIYNKNTSRKHGLQPFYIMYVCKPRDMIFNKLKPSELDINKPDHRTYIEEFSNIQNLIDYDINKNIKKYQKGMKDYADKTRKEIIYKIGDKVLIKNQRRTNTLNKIRFIGPYTVIGSFNNYNNYVLYRQQNNPLYIHVNKLIKYNTNIPRNIIDNNIEQYIDMEPIDYEDINDNNDNYGEILPNDDEKDEFEEDADMHNAIIEAQPDNNNIDEYDLDINQLENMLNELPMDNEENTNIPQTEIISESGIQPTEVINDELTPTVIIDDMSIDTNINNIQNINQPNINPNAMNNINMNINNSNNINPNQAPNNNALPPTETYGSSVDTTVKLTTSTITTTEPIDSTSITTTVKLPSTVNENENENVNGLPPDPNEIPPAVQNMPIVDNPPNDNPNMPFIDDSNDLNLPDLNLLKMILKKIIQDKK